MSIIAELIGSLPDLICSCLFELGGKGEKKEGTGMGVRVDSDFPALDQMDESPEIRATSQRTFRSNK
jgi:hypothetical protein